MNNNITDFTNMNSKRNPTKEEEQKEILQLNYGIFPQQHLSFYCRDCNKIENILSIAVTSQCMVAEDATEEDLKEVASRLVFNIGYDNIGMRCKTCGAITKSQIPIFASLKMALEEKGYYLDTIAEGNVNIGEDMIYIVFEAEIDFPDTNIPDAEYWTLTNLFVDSPDGESKRSLLSINMRHREDFPVATGDNDFVNKCLEVLFNWIGTLESIV